MSEGAEELQKRWADDEEEVAAIKRRADAEYRHEPGEQYTPMLRDIRFLLGRLNVVTEFWQSAERELDNRALKQSRVKKQKIADQLRESDVTAQLSGRDDIMYGPHDSLPPGQHVARRRSRNEM